MNKTEYQNSINEQSFDKLKHLLCNYSTNKAEFSLKKSSTEISLVKTDVINCVAWATYVTGNLPKYRTA